MGAASVDDATAIQRPASQPASSVVEVENTSSAPVGGHENSLAPDENSLTGTKTHPARVESVDAGAEEGEGRPCHEARAHACLGMDNRCTRERETRVCGGEEMREVGGRCVCVCVCGEWREER